MDFTAESVNKICYPAGWLARYDLALNSGDLSLKIAEGKQIETTLREAGKWGRIGSYLDVGTCTGRYLLLLRQAVRDDGMIVGIDDEPDCIQFARGKVRNHCPDDTRISIFKKNFIAENFDIGEKFELLTCMMSTLSHFGHNRNPKFEDLLQIALQRLASLLSMNGVLIFSTWSQVACESLKFLSIYGAQDCRNLTAWTPTESELKIRLQQAGLTKYVVTRPHPLLNVWVCSK